LLSETVCAILQVPTMERMRSWKWWSDRAGQAEESWRTRLGEGQNIYNGSTSRGAVAAKADEAWRIDTTGIGGRSQLHLCNW
jgi:hypothetical protein